MAFGTAGLDLTDSVGSENDAGRGVKVQVDCEVGGEEKDMVMLGNAERRRCSSASKVCNLAVSRSYDPGSFEKLWHPQYYSRKKVNKINGFKTRHTFSPNMFDLRMLLLGKGKRMARLLC